MSEAKVRGLGLANTRIARAWCQGLVRRSRMDGTNHGALKVVETPGGANVSVVMPLEFVYSGLIYSYSRTTSVLWDKIDLSRWRTKTHHALPPLNLMYAIRARTIRWAIGKTVESPPPCVR